MSEPVPAGTFLRPLSAELVRVLAQAADSAFAPPAFFVVARYEPADPETTTAPFDVQRPVEKFEMAQELVEELKKRHPGVEYGIFGPFRNDDPIVPPLEQATVAQIRITPQVGTKLEEPFTIAGEAFDALFYSVQAVEKFLVPYYVQEIGPEFARHVLKVFSEAPLALVAHLPWSEEFQVLDTAGQVLQQDAATGAEAQAAPRTRYVPVLFQRDTGGAMQARPLYPPVRGRE